MIPREVWMLMVIIGAIGMVADACYTRYLWLAVDAGMVAAGAYLYLRERD